MNDQKQLEAAYGYQARRLAKAFQLASMKGPLHVQALTAAVIETAKQIIEEARKANETEGNANGPQQAP